MGAEFNENHVHMHKILTSLDILYNWTKIHESILERYQVKKNFGFGNFIQSESYAATLLNLLHIHIPVLN